MPRIPLRTFLAQTSRVTLALGAAPLLLQAQPASTKPKPETKPKAGGSSGDPITELNEAITTVLKGSPLPGFAIALVQGGKLLWQKGFGFKDAAAKTPVDDRTVFEAASVSKTVFAYAVLKLCERGLLGLDVPLTTYAAKPFLQGDSRLGLITARHVLSHTTGFQDWRSGAEPLRIHFTPGTRFQYSGEGFHYLQSVMTRLTGRVDPSLCAQYEAGLEVCATDIDPYLKRTLLTPFGMDSSTYVWNKTLEEHVARPHDENGKPLTKSKPSAIDAARYASAGGLHTTVGDYARFLTEVLAPKPSDAFRLTGRSLQEMFRPQIKLAPEEKVDGASAWGLGWGLQEQAISKVIVHSGGQTGFRSLAMACPERKTGFIILTNAECGGQVIGDPRLTGILERFLAG